MIKKIFNSGGYFHGYEWWKFGLRFSVSNPWGNWWAYHTIQLVYPNTNMGAKVLLTIPYKKVKCIRKCYICGFSTHQHPWKQYLAGYVGKPSFSLFKKHGHWRNSVCNFCKEGG